MKDKKKVAVVTGAGGDMGFTISKMLSAQDVNVLMIDLKSPKQKIPHGTQFAEGDVTDPNFLKETINHFADDKGHINYLVNCAGVLWFDKDTSLVEIDLDVWDKVIDINLKGTALAVRYTVPWMKLSGNGSMVHISSIQALRGDKKAQDAYGASKAGLLALSKSLAIQLAEYKIRSNAILPGAIHTQMQKRWTDDSSLARKVSANVPLGRLGTKEDIANATSFLLSDTSSYITGTELIVDGGLMALP